MLWCPSGGDSREAIARAAAGRGRDFAEQVQTDIVSEEDNVKVKQIVIKVRLGEVEAGIVYVSDVIGKRAWGDARHTDSGCLQSDCHLYPLR